MSIYVYKNNLQSGPFEDAAVLAWLKDGRLTGEDFGCRAGASGWQPLKALFPNGAQPAAAVAAPVSGGGQAFVNQPVVNWARQNLRTPVEIGLRYSFSSSKIFVGFTYAFFGVLLLWLPCAILVSAIHTFITEGWKEQVSGGLTFGSILLVVLGGLFFGVIYALRRTRNKIATVLNSEGVETRGGRKYGWENLYFLNYKKVSTRVRGNLAASVAQSALFAGAEKTTIELVFADGKAIVPPLIANQQEILGLLAGVPAQRRSEGQIRQ